MANILDRFWIRAAEVSGSTFCHFVEPRGTSRITYGDMAAYVGRYSEMFAASGAARGSVVLLFLPHSLDLYAAFLGAMTAGLIPSIMPKPTPKQDPALYWSSHDALLKRIGGAWILGDDDVLRAMGNAGLPVAGRTLASLHVGDTSIATARPSFAPQACSDIALLQHSSGTTGLKKGVQLSFDEISAQLDSYSRAIGIDSGDVVVSWLPLYHDMGLVACFLLPVYFGIPFVHMDAFHWLARPSLLLDLIDQHKGTLAWLPNFAFDHLVSVVPAAKAANYRLSSLRAIINCSEVCRPDTTSRFATRFAAAGLSPTAVQCCYAMAETVFAVTQTNLGSRIAAQAFDRTSLEPGNEVVALPADDPRARRVSDCGRAIDGIEVVVRDDVGTAVPDGTVGQITVNGRFVFAGYFKNSALSAERLRNGWYYTQDIGFVIDGRLFVLGRKDDVIICNGKNIYAHDIEVSLVGVAGVKPGRCVAISVEDSKAGTQKFAIIAERDSEGPSDEEKARKTIASLAFAAAGIAPHSVHIVAPGWLVKTTSGKISRKENAIKFSSSLRSSAA